MYIRDFDRLAENASTADELYEQMLTLYPDRVNPGSLWSSARAEKGESKRLTVLSPTSDRLEPRKELLWQ